MTEEQKKEELKQVTLVEKHPMPLDQLRKALNGMERLDAEFGYIYKYIVVDRPVTTDHIKFNSVYGKIELHVDKQEAHMWVINADREIADRIIKNAFTIDD